MFFCYVFQQKIEAFFKTSASNSVSVPDCSPAGDRSSNGCDSKRMCLNGGPLGISAPPPAWDPVLLHLTLHSIPPVGIILIRNGWFQEATNIFTPRNITIVFMARRSVVGESGFRGGHVSFGGELFVLDTEMAIGWAS